MRIIKTTNPDGTQSVEYEFSDMDEYRTYAQMETQMTTPVEIGSLGVMFRSAMTAPAVAPEIVGDEIDDEAENDEEDESVLAYHKKTGKRGPTRIKSVNPPAPAGRWPDLFYITAEGWETVELLRKHPAGLTSKQVDQILGLTHTVGSGRLNALMRITPMVERFGNAYRLSVIGRDTSLQFELDERPSPRNKNLGWDRFMAIPLRDGRQSRRKRRPA
jgi:hypothetical protein